MRHYKVVLQLREVVGRDGYVAKRAETGSHAVNGTSDVSHLGVEVLAAFLYGFGRFFAQVELVAFFDYFAYTFYREPLM